MNGKLLDRIESLFSSHKALVLIIIGLFLIRIPSLLEPLWYGDEAIYVTIGQEINRGGLLYVDIFDHKTPGIYYLAAWSMKILGDTIWSFKFLLSLWLIPTIYVFHQLAKSLFDKKAALYSTLILALFLATPLFEGNIVNSEVLMILPTSLAIIFGFKKRYFLSGVLFSLALLLKFPAIFDFAAFFIFVFLSLDQKRYTETIKNLMKLTIGMAVPFGITFIYFSLEGALGAYITNAFLFNLSYTNYGNKFIIPNGLLIVKAFPLFMVSLYSLWRILTKEGRKFGQKLGNFEFMIIWLVFSYYGAVFGGRAYIHYLIQPLAPLSIIIGQIITSKKLRGLGFTIIIITIALTFLLEFRPFSNIPNVVSYYTNAAKFIFNKMSLEDYQNKFDPNTSRNYSLASFIASCKTQGGKEDCDSLRTTEEDRIYLWANQPAVYFLSNRKPASKYITAFHTLGSDSAKKEVIKNLRENNPKYIIVDNNGPKPFPELDLFINNRYNLFAISENYRIYEISSDNKTL